MSSIPEASGAIIGGFIHQVILLPKKSAFTKIQEFNKKSELSEKLGLDDRDSIILSLLQKDPNISQEEIGQKIKLSQPSVGARLKSLAKKGLLERVNGVNFRTVDLYLAKVDITSTSSNDIIEQYKDCPFFVNALVTSGRYNLCLLFMATSLKRLEQIVNFHLRGNPKVKDIELNIVISTAKDLVLPLNIDFENQAQLDCKQKCRECDSPIEKAENELLKIKKTNKLD